jgi:hypothetical protein
MDATRILFPVFPLFPPFDTSYVENVIRKLKHLHCEQGRNWPILKGGGKPPKCAKMEGLGAGA